jgi:phosphoglycerate dehydrogenase-like enzyme
VVIAFPPNVDDEVLAPLRHRFPDVEIVTQPFLGRVARRAPDRDDALTAEERAVWAGAEATVALDLPHDIRSLAPRLRWVQAVGAGIDHLAHVDLPDDCVVTNAAGVAAAPIAEFALARLLAVWKRLPELDLRQAQREWRPVFGRTIEGATLGVIGLGAIGSAVAVRAHAFGMRVLATRRRHSAGDGHDAVEELFGSDALHAVLARCDAVVLSAPATPATENLFDEAAFTAMRPGALFCNVSRGALVDETALIAALESGHLGAAILDVARQEPLPHDDPLWSAPNVHISAHCSAAQDQYVEKLLELFTDNLERLRQGEPLRNVVDRGAGY